MKKSIIVFCLFVLGSIPSFADDAALVLRNFNDMQPIVTNVFSALPHIEFLIKSNNIRQTCFVIGRMNLSDNYLFAADLNFNILSQSKESVEKLKEPSLAAATAVNKIHQTVVLLKNICIDDNASFDASEITKSIAMAQASYWEWQKAYEAVSGLQQMQSK